jgi:hypothetical protein
MLSTTTVTLQHNQRERYYGKKIDACYYEEKFLEQDVIQYNLTKYLIFKPWEVS